jgi:peptide-methionine (S)-S-oxide reductase
MKTTLFVLSIAALTGAFACRGATTSSPDPELVRSASVPAAAAPDHLRSDPGGVGEGTPLAAQSGNELAAFSAGCFWGVEDTFRHVPGVVATAVGYTGGHTERPTYESVCSHTTGHAESVLVEYDPKRVSYDTLLNVFFKNHDPTTRNRQGPDVGDQYRSAIWTFSPAQEAAAHAAETREQSSYTKPVVTEIRSIARFWKAEEYHQQYDEKTGTHSCPVPKGLPGQRT